MIEYRYIACGGVLVKENQVLILMRPSRNEVRLPKGHIETGESLEQAAQREVFEEAGYSEIEVIADLGEQLVEFDHDGRHFVRTEHYFLMAPRDTEQGPRTQGEHQFYPVWLSWEEAMETLSNM